MFAVFRDAMHFDCKRRAWVRSAVSEVSVLIGRKDMVDKATPTHYP